MSNRRPLTEHEKKVAENLFRIWNAKKSSLGLTQDKAGQALDMTQGAVGQYLNARVPLSINALLGFSKILGVSPTDIDPLFDYPFQRAESDQAADMQVKDAGVTYRGPTRKDKPDILQVPVMNAEFSMGSGIYQPERDAIIDFMRLSMPWVRSQLVITKPDALRVVIGLGDSMSPTFSSGDPLLVDTGVTDLKIDGIYCMARDDELLIKRIQRDIDGGFTIISDNPNYRPQHIDSPERSGIQVLGRVVWTWNGRRL